MMSSIKKIIKKHFLINSLIHLKLNSLKRIFFFNYRLLILIYDFMNISENKLYIIVRTGFDLNPK